MYINFLEIYAPQKEIDFCKVCGISRIHCIMLNCAIYDIHAMF